MVSLRKLLLTLGIVVIAVYCVGLCASCDCAGSKTTDIADTGVRIKTRIANKAYCLFKITVRPSAGLIKIYNAEDKLNKGKFECLRYKIYDMCIMICSVPSIIYF